MVDSIANVSGDASANSHFRTCTNRADMSKSSGWCPQGHNRDTSLRWRGACMQHADMFRFYMGEHSYSLMECDIISPEAAHQTVG